ncbi:MAG: hypothetical protein MPK31_04470, partial [Gammaproteobacteria bacterium]|nr:hypothetical protein [Gammaproteobacteria bacterium]
MPRMIPHSRNRPRNLRYHRARPPPAAGANISGPAFNQQPGDDMEIFGEFFQLENLFKLGQIILVDLVLAGDNAI